MTNRLSHAENLVALHYRARRAGRASGKPAVRIGRLIGLCCDAVIMIALPVAVLTSLATALLG